MAIVGVGSPAASLTTPRPTSKSSRGRQSVPPGSLVSTSVGCSSSSASSAAGNDEAGERPLSDAQTMTIQRLQCFKTKRCKFWQEGRCTRGERCTYAHTEVELRVPPDLTKTKICTRWKRGTCDKSPQDCAYAHGCDDLRDAHNQRSSPPPQRKHSSDTISTASASSEIETPSPPSSSQASRWCAELDDTTPPAMCVKQLRFDFLTMSQVCQSLNDIYYD